MILSSLNRGYFTPVYSSVKSLTGFEAGKVVFIVSAEGGCSGREGPLVSAMMLSSPTPEVSRYPLYPRVHCNKAQGSNSRHSPSIPAWPFFPCLMHISVTAAAAPQISQLAANVVIPGVLMLRMKVHSSGPVYHALAFFGRVKSGGIICGPREGKPLSTITVSLGEQRDAWATSFGLSEDLKLFPGWHSLNKVLALIE